jgi:hypothetical protein
MPTNLLQDPTLAPLLRHLRRGLGIGPTALGGLSTGKGKEEEEEKVSAELWIGEAYIKDNRELKIIFHVTLLTHFRSNY